MRRGRKACRLGCALGLVLLVARELPAEDKWYEHYQGALKSISSRKWADAEKKLKAAMASGPVPGRQVRMYGVRFIDYLPEYHLGLVYFNQQRYADALEQFTKAKAAGYVSPGDPEFANMNDMAELCRIRTAGKVKAVPDGQKESEALVRFARELMGRGSLEDARRALDSAASKTPGSADVASAREELVRLETEKRIRAEQERQAKEAAARQAEAKDVAPVEAARPADRGQAARDAQRSETEGRAASPAPTAPPEPVRAPGNPAERAAFESFYSGDYKTAADRFEALARKAARPRLQLLLAYAACSRAGLGLLRGEGGGAGELDLARELYARAGPAARQLIARDGLISPRIVGALTGGKTGRLAGQR